MAYTGRVTRSQCAYHALLRSGSISPASHNGMPVVGHLAAVRRSILVRRIADLPEGSFAFVMATGIVSIAAAQQGLTQLSALLLLINTIAFATLLPLTLLRLVRIAIAAWGITFIGMVRHLIALLRRRGDASLMQADPG
jgi:hypothetical protein